MLILSFNIVNAARLTTYTTFFCNHFHTMTTVFLAMDIWALYQECYNNKHESSRDIEIGLGWRSVLGLLGVIWESLKVVKTPSVSVSSCCCAF